MLYKEKIKLLKEVQYLIMELKDLKEFDYKKIGIAIYEYEHPSVETLSKLKEYAKNIKGEKEVTSYEK